MGVATYPEVGERVSLEGTVSRDEFWQFKKEMQEDVARRDGADQVREQFASERRWYIGIIIALAGLSAGFGGSLIGVILS